MIEVHEVKTRRDRQQFLRLPYHIYRYDPAWVPPLELERLELLDRRKHPFYRHGDATSFIATRGGQIVGRILASDDPLYNSIHGENLGGFGMFESVDDADVARCLIGAASEWLRGRGRDRLRGPMDFSLNYQCGLLVDGFDTPPRIIMNHNPPSYERLLNACGLVKAKDFYAFWFEGTHDLTKAWERRAKRLAASNVVIRAANRGNMIDEFRRCAPIFNEAWSRNWGASPMTDAEFEFFGKTLKQIAYPELLLAAEVDGKPVGFSMMLPDINEALKSVGGRLFHWGLPIGLIRLLWGIKRIKTARLVALGILDEYRRRGIAELLVLRSFEAFRRLGFENAELSWTLEDNRLINRVVEAAGGKRYKTYRMFEKSLAG